mgnify:CR=1 FL=1|jgi:hypothetical protein
MVIRINHTGPATTATTVTAATTITHAIPMQHLGWLGQRGNHTGQDALQELRMVHGRSAPRALSAPLYRRSELGELDSIKIDEPLLTGNLEQDISILNIVA